MNSLSFARMLKDSAGAEDIARSCKMKANKANKNKIKQNMKRNFILICLIVAATTTVVCWRNHQAAEAAEAAVAALPEEAKQRVSSPARPAAARESLTPEKQAAVSRSWSAPASSALEEELKDKVVVNLGKVEDIGARLGAVLVAQGELNTLNAVPTADRSAEQARRLRDLERNRAAALGALPEVSAFQDNPDEYSRFFGSLLQRSASLDEPQTRVVADYMRARGAAMIAAGLNAAREPRDTAAADEWEEKRDAFNEATVDGVSAILPPGEAARIGFTGAFMELLEQDFDKAK